MNSLFSLNSKDLEIHLNNGLDISFEKFLFYHCKNTKDIPQILFKLIECFELLIEKGHNPLTQFYDEEKKCSLNTITYIFLDDNVLLFEFFLFKKQFNYLETIEDIFLMSKFCPDLKNFKCFKCCQEHVRLFLLRN
jgi:hypothetical protein